MGLIVGVAVAGVVLVVIGIIVIFFILKKKGKKPKKETAQLHLSADESPYSPVFSYKQQTTTYAPVAVANKIIPEAELTIEDKLGQG